MTKRVQLATLSPKMMLSTTLLTLMEKWILGNRSKCMPRVTSSKVKENPGTVFLKNLPKFCGHDVCQFILNNYLEIFKKGTYSAQYN